MDEREERAFYIYSVFKKSVVNRFAEYEEIEQSLKDNYSKFLTKFKEETNVKCHNEIKNLLQEDFYKNKNDFENKDRILEECYEKYGYGLIKRIDESVLEIEKIDSVLNECNMGCMYSQEEKEDRQLKKCFEKCFEDSFKSVMKIQKEILSSIEENYLKLNKM